MKFIICFFTFLTGAFFVSAQDASDILGLLSSDGKILYGNEPNSIMVIDYPENMDRIENYLSMVDVAPPQVLVEARVVEVKLEGEKSLGINWSAFAEDGGLDIGEFTAGATSGAALAQSIPYKTTYYPPGTTIAANEEDPFTLTIFDKNINVVLSALANTYDTNILSAPSITSVNNREAEIKVIRSLPWAEPSVSETEAGGLIVNWDVHFEEVGIVLKVTPIITQDGKISLTLKPEVSEYVDDFTLEINYTGVDSIEYNIPVIDKRNADTKVVIGNGETLIIGGLMKEKTIEGTSKVPLLGDVPGLGWLFKSKRNYTEKTELLLFVSPTIVTPNVVKSMEAREEYDTGKWYMDERKAKQEEILNALRAEHKGLFGKLSVLQDKADDLSRRRRDLENDVSGM